MTASTSVGKVTPPRSMSILGAGKAIVGDAMGGVGYQIPTSNQTKHSDTIRELSGPHARDRRFNQAWQVTVIILCRTRWGGGAPGFQGQHCSVLLCRGSMEAILKGPNAVPPVRLDQGMLHWGPAEYCSLPEYAVLGGHAYSCRCWHRYRGGSLSVHACPHAHGRPTPPISLWVFVIHLWPSQGMQVCICTVIMAAIPTPARCPENPGILTPARPTLDAVR